ncbi:hypothetical protein B0H12DRAFT_1069328 [Mycena haematopus]|nr:hypothetical protein B0H12DRAFT_1069328 [Mycena haematopus]
MYWFETNWNMIQFFSVCLARSMQLDDVETGLHNLESSASEMMNIDDIVYSTTSKVLMFEEKSYEVVDRLFEPQNLDVTVTNVASVQFRGPRYALHEHSVEMLQ